MAKKHPYEKFSKGIKDEHGNARIMAFADNYLMVRRKGCIPFTVYIKDVGPGKRWEWVQK